MNTITISVTQEDIDQGCRQSGSNCPIALAFIRTLGLQPPMIVDVTLTEVFVFDPNGDYPATDDRDFCLPQEASSFIEAFDDGEPVTPFSFEAVERTPVS